MKICQQVLPLFLRKKYEKTFCIIFKANNLQISRLCLCPHKNYSSSSQAQPTNEALSVKINSPDFYSLLTPELKTLSEFFKSRNYELRMAGGAVRDLLSNIRPLDIDFATTATPEQMRNMFREEHIRKFNIGGEPYGTYSVRINDKENFQVTTLRIDFVRDGRTMPKFITDWRLDASRRDLTINAMYLGLDGTLYDYFNGVDDLKNKTIRFVESAKDRIKEDHLRILRYFRFYGQIAETPNNHDPNTLKIIQENMNGLSMTASERINIELWKILSGKFRFDMLKTMLLLGIAPHIGLPSEPNITALQQLQERADNLNLQPISLLLPLIESEDQFQDMFLRLKPSNDETELALFLIRHRYVDNPLKYYQTFILESPVSKQAKVTEMVKELLKYRGDTDLLKQFREWEIPRFPIKGATLIAKGLHPGIRGSNNKKFGRVVLALKKIWIGSNCTMTEEQLLEQLPAVIREDTLQYAAYENGKKKSKY